MSLFPLIDHFRAPKQEGQSQMQTIDNALGLSPEIAALAALGGDYQNDLNDLVDPVLEEHNVRQAVHEQEASALEETDKRLGDYISMEQRKLTAKKGIHAKLSQHQQFLLKNHADLQKINQEHLLNTAGLRLQQAKNAANYNGVVAARQNILNRMRQGAQ
jgi:hypothetical protein